MASRHPGIQAKNGAVVGLGARVLAATVGLGCMGLLVLSARLTPDAAGHGTHTQLGMPPCGWAVYFGRPCATCGMTTAFAHAAHGNLAASFRASPMGMLLAVATATAFWGALHVACTGSRVGVLCGRLLRPRVLWCVLGLTLASWAYRWVTWT